MRDHILEAIFLDVNLWKEVIDKGVEKKIDNKWLSFFSDPNNRAAICYNIGKGEYHINPPHTGYKKKDDGSERTFLINEPKDRLLLNAIYKWLTRHEAKMIHPSCKSYQAGIGIGKIVKDVSKRIVKLSSGTPGQIIGRKFDINKYFESIPRKEIHKIFNILKHHHGNSSVIDLLEDYYDNDIYFDSKQKEVINNYQGIKQGSAVSAWLANVLLYEIDEILSRREGLYVRYSDDILYIGHDYEVVTQILKEKLSQIGLRLKEEKISDIYTDKYICFLGFEIRGENITLSKKWVKKFQEEIDKRSIKNIPLIKKISNLRKENFEKNEPQIKKLVGKTQRSIFRYLMYGNGRFSWATEVLTTVNNYKDLLTLSNYCLDAIRAVYTGKTNIGGLGKSLAHDIQRGKGRNVRSNYLKSKHLNSDPNDEDILSGFISIPAIQKIIGNKWLFRTIVSDIIKSPMIGEYGKASSRDNFNGNKEEIINQLEHLYEIYLYSKPNGDKVERFYALSLDDMNMDMLISGENRQESLKNLEKYLKTSVDFDTIKDKEKDWYWQSKSFPQLILLKSWFQPI